MSPGKEDAGADSRVIRSCRYAGVTIEAFRYRNGELRADEAWPVAAIRDAILESGGVVEDIDVDDPVHGADPNMTWRYSA